MNSAVGAPAAATTAPPITGPSTNVAEKATFSAAFALRSGLRGRTSSRALARLARSSQAAPATCLARGGHLGAQQRAGRQRRGSVERDEQQHGRQPEVPQQDRERGGRDRLEDVQPAQLAATGGRLDPGDDRGHDERGQGLPGEEQRRDRDRAVRVVEDGERQGDQAEPGAQPVDRVGGDDPPQPRGAQRAGERSPCLSSMTSRRHATGRLRWQRALQGRSRSTERLRRRRRGARADAISRARPRPPAGAASRQTTGSCG